MMKTQQMNSVQSYIVESLAPLVFRSGKPFGSQASTQDIIFPLPSAAAGLIRALAIGQGKLTMSQNGTEMKTQQTDADYQKVLSTASQGPFLVRFNDSKQSADKKITPELLLPKPANALYFENTDNEIELIRLLPKPFDDADACGSDLPDKLLPVQMQKQVKGKPKLGAMYWTLDHLRAWQQGESLTFTEVNEQGLNQLPIDIRTHVAIDDASDAAEDGKLFQTAGFDLAHQRNPDFYKLNKNKKDDEKQTTWSTERYGFLVQTEQNIVADVATFGGERRLSYIKPVDNVLTQSVDSLATLQQNIQQKKGFCLTFLTPTIFAKGFLPDWLDGVSFEGTIPNTAIEVALKAVAIDRWQGVSGWDSIVWKPKATRKAVCAGSVYWFECRNPDALTPETTEMLVNMLWSDNQQDKYDGFGVALLTPWHSHIE